MMSSIEQKLRYRREIMNRARVFNIERCSTEDGPGIRTTVFLKGCLLRCRWCANPESQTFEKQILLKAVKCVGCGRCQKTCPSQAISYIPEFGMITDGEKCNLCGQCLDACYVDARVIQGEEYTVEELMKVLERDESYYRLSGGGITFSGGEPLLYSSFIKECAQQIHKKGWTVLIETCGHIPQKRIEEVADHVDIIYCDFKHHSPEEHRRLTGQDNSDILNNIRWLDQHFKGELYLRYPYIPGCNDRSEDIEKFLEFAEGINKVDEVVFLPYHRLGLEKYQGLGRTYEMGDMPSLKVKDLQFLKEYESKYNLKIKIQ